MRENVVAKTILIKIVNGMNIKPLLLKKKVLTLVLFMSRDFSVPDLVFSNLTSSN